MAGERAMSRALRHTIDIKMRGETLSGRASLYR
jgi:hypothetical protein